MNEPSHQQLYRMILLDITIGLLVAIALVWLSLYTYGIATKAERNANDLSKTVVTTYALCTSLNELKQSLRSFIVVIPPPNETPAQKTYINNLIHEANVAFKQVACVKPKG